MSNQFVLELSKVVDITTSGKYVAACILNRIANEIADDINEANEEFLDYFFNGVTEMTEFNNYDKYVDEIANEIADAILSISREDLAEIIRGNKDSRSVLMKDVETKEKVDL